MKKFKTMVCIITTLALLLTIIPVTAKATAAEGSTDTLSKTQEQYLKDLQILSMQRADDSVLIEQTVETYLSLQKASTRAIAVYNAEPLVAEADMQNRDIQYRQDEAEYTYKIRQASNRTVVYDDINFKNFTYTIENGTAKASVVEDYKYYIDDGFGEISNRIRQYNFTLVKVGNLWKVSSVTTNDPWEINSEFDYSFGNVDERVQAVITDVQGVPAIKELTPETRALTKWTYDRDKAVTYASAWYNDVNETFGEASEDCQNFASQCVWAGLGGEDKSTIKEYPVVYDSTYGSTNSRLWQHNNYYKDNASADNGYGWYWDNVCGFAYYIQKSLSTTKGPYGIVYFGNLDNADKGDVISWDTNGKPGYGTLDHAMVVTKVTGTAGERGTSDIYIAAHNSNTNAAKEALTDYAGYAESKYATAHILRAYY